MLNNYIDFYNITKNLDVPVNEPFLGKICKESNLRNILLRECFTIIGSMFVYPNKDSQGNYINDFISLSDTDKNNRLEDAKIAIVAWFCGKPETYIRLSNTKHNNLDKYINYLMDYKTKYGKYVVAKAKKENKDLDVVVKECRDYLNNKMLEHAVYYSIYRGPYLPSFGASFSRKAISTLKEYCEKKEVEKRGKFNGKVSNFLPFAVIYCSYYLIKDKFNDFHKPIISPNNELTTGWLGKNGFNYMNYFKEPDVDIIKFIQKNTADGSSGSFIIELSDIFETIKNEIEIVEKPIINVLFYELSYTNKENDNFVFVDELCEVFSRTKKALKEYI